MTTRKMLTSQTACEMTAIPGGIIECVHTQASLAMLRDLSVSSRCNWDLLSSPLQIDGLNRSIILSFSPLSHEYENQIISFKSTHKPLLKFLKTDAFIYEEAGNTCTTLFFEDSAHELVGFCSTKCSSLKIKKSKLLSLCPSIEIAALCVSDKYRYMGIGQAIFHHTIQQIYKIKKLAGVQLVTLFALPEAVAFYKKLKCHKMPTGVKIFYTPAHEFCIPMYLTLPHIVLENGDPLNHALTKPIIY